MAALTPTKTTVHQMPVDGQYKMATYTVTAGGQSVTNEWIATGGESVAEVEHQVEERTSFEYRTWAYIEPEELQVAEPYGSWTVKLGLNGKELEAFSFEVVRRGAPAEFVSRPRRMIP